MTDILKECYKCKSAENAEITRFDRTVRYKGKVVTYKHEGHFCNKCKRVYDHKPNQTEANAKRLQDAWLKTV